MERNLQSNKSRLRLRIPLQTLPRAIACGYGDPISIDLATVFRGARPSNEVVSNPGRVGRDLNFNIDETIYALSTSIYYCNFDSLTAFSTRV